MSLTRARRVSPRLTARSLRYIPQLERIEDRLAPGQVFDLFTDPFSGPLPALLDSDDEDRDLTSALARSLNGQGSALSDTSLAGVGIAVPGLQHLGTPVQETVAAPLSTSAAMESLAQVVASFADAPLEGTSIQDGMNVTLEGTLEVMHGRRLDDTGDEHYFFLNTGNARIELSHEEILHDLEGGTVIRVQGQMRGGTLVADPDGITVTQASPPEGEELPPPDQGGLGEGGGTIQGGYRSILVINFNFQDRTSQPWTTTSVENIFNNQVVPWMYEMSYGSLEMYADVAGWFTLPTGSSTCAYSSWATQAQNAARAAGWEPSAYNHVVYAFPRVPACGWSGLGQMPGRFTWLNNAMNLGVAAHELGHNLGLAHSSSRRYSQGPLDGSFSQSEYGDPYDTMGAAGNRALFHGWYRASRNYIPSWDRITVTPSDGEAYVSLLSTAAWQGPRLLRVQRSGRSDYLYFEWREPVGYDYVTALRSAAVANGVMVYLSKSGNSISNQTLVDYHHTTTTVSDAPLPVGEILYDYAGDVGIYPYYRADGYTDFYIWYGLG
jgi:hypothetical protein